MQHRNLDNGVRQTFGGWSNIYTKTLAMSVSKTHGTAAERARMQLTGTSLCHAERLPMLTRTPLLSRRWGSVAVVMSSNPKTFTSNCFLAVLDLQG